MRVRTASQRLQKKNYQWREPTPCVEADILRVHSPQIFNAVRSGSFFDSDTPNIPGLYEHALLAAGSACNAAEAALNGQPAFSLMRPPGHHAERNRVMGFCYFNNIAIAVARVLEGKGGGDHKPPLQRVVIVDFDCHHGNGTEDIFLGDQRVLFVSLHQSPCYPGTGLRSRENCRNYPLPPNTDENSYLVAFDRALDEIRNFQPQLLAISAGFDAHEADPITEMGLEVETFGKIGERLRALHVPTFAVLEGGYGMQFAACVEVFVESLNG